MKCLFVDCTMRDNSRTRILANSFFEELDSKYEVKHLMLEKENLKPLVGDFYHDREKLLKEGNLNHPRFKYAHELQEADLIVVAAPFWDLSFPALLKIYIENCSVDGITFKTSEKGLEGLCKSNNLIYLTTRGGVYTNDPSESAIPQLKNLCAFFGIDNLQVVAADGMDIVGYDSKKSLEDAIIKAKEIAKTQ